MKRIILTLFSLTLLTACGSNSSDLHATNEPVNTDSANESTDSISTDKLQPDVLEIGGSMNDNYFHYGAFLNNPNDSEDMEFVGYKVVLKDSNGHILGIDENTTGPAFAGETIAVSGLIECSNGTPASVDMTASCDDYQYGINSGAIPSSSFYFKGLAYYPDSCKITGFLYDNNEKDCPLVQIDAIFKRDGTIIYGMNGYCENAVPGENAFEVDLDTVVNMDFDTIELYAKDWSPYEDHKTDSSFTPESDPKNENVIVVNSQSDSDEPGHASATLDTSIRNDDSTDVDESVKTDNEASEIEDIANKVKDETNSIISDVGGTVAAALGKEDYETIYNNYSKQLTEKTPLLLEEYDKEAANNTNGIDGLASICNNKIQVLAEISNEGVEKMADYMYASGGNYSDYQEWATKLYNVYMNESTTITNHYMSSITG